MQKIARSGAADIARGSAWLRHQPQRFQDDVLVRMVPRRFCKDEIICHAGDPCEGLHLLTSGMLRMELPTAGDDFRTFSLRQSGFWFGQEALVPGAKNRFTVTCATDATALCLPLAEFEQLMSDPYHCRSMAALTLEHLDEALQVVGHFLAAEPEGRVAARLMLLARDAMSPPPAVLRITQCELAEMCALSRLKTQQVLSRLEARGLITCGYRRIQINDNFHPAALMTRRSS